jgi:hypothetical protein
MQKRKSITLKFYNFINGVSKNFFGSFNHVNSLLKFGDGYSESSIKAFYSEEFSAKYGRI